MQDPQTVVGWASAVAMMGGAAILDVRSRRVPSIYWTPWALVAAALTAGRLSGDASRLALIVHLAAPAMVAGLAYLLWRLRLWGGADAKAVMVLAFLAPSPWILDLAPPAVAAILVGSVLVCLVPPMFLVANLVKGDVRFPGALLGLRLPMEKARRLHMWPLQVPAPDGRLRWRVRPRIGEDVQAAYDALQRAGLDRVWVTPKIPFLALAALGVVASAAWVWSRFG